MNNTIKRFGFLSDAIQLAECEVEDLKNQQSYVDSKLSAIVKVDYKWVNRVVKVTKKGRITDKSSRAILVVELDNGTKCDFVAYTKEIGEYEFWNDFTKVFGPDEVKVMKVDLMKRLGIEVGEHAQKAADEAQKNIDRRLEKATSAREKAYNNGREKFISGRIANAEESARKAWDKLELEFS